MPSFATQKVFRIYRSLDPEQIRFVLDKKIEGNFTVNDWLNRLNRIAFMDLLGDETRQQAGRLAITFMGFSMVTLLLSILKPVLFFFPIGFMIIFSYFFSIYISLLRIDLGNHLRIFLVPLIKQLREQINERSLIYFNLDFSSAVSERNLVQPEETKSSKDTKIFRHLWMKGKMELNDKNEIDWNVEDTVIEKQSRFSDKAEKMKFRDYRISHKLRFQLKAPSNRYLAVNNDIPGTDGFYIISIEKENYSKSLEEGMDPALFISCMDEAYTMIRPVNS